MPEFDTAAIRARLDAATPGPWEARHGGYSWVALYDDEDKFSEGESLPSFEPGGSATPADAEFIAHAPSDIAALLTAHDRAQQVYESALRRSVRTNGWSADDWEDFMEGVLHDLRAALDGAHPTPSDGSE